MKFSVLKIMESYFSEKSFNCAYWTKCVHIHIRVSHFKVESLSQKGGSVNTNAIPRCTILPNKGNLPLLFPKCLGRVVNLGRIPLWYRMLQVELLQRNFIENTFIWRPGTYHRLCIDDDLYIGLDTHTNCILIYDVVLSQTDGVCHLFLFCFVLTDGERMAYAGLPFPCTGWSVPDVTNIYLI